MYRTSILQKAKGKGSVADPGPGSGASLTPDPGSRIPNLYFFESLTTIFWLKSYIILCKLAHIFYFASSKIKQYNFVIFVATKKGRTTNFFSPLSFVAFLDPGWTIIRIRDPG
jgi:hypothetical protein